MKKVSKLMMLRLYWWSFVAFAILSLIISFIGSGDMLIKALTLVLLVDATILFVWCGRYLDDDAWSLAKSDEEDQEALINEMDDVPQIDPVTKVRKILNRTDKSDQWKIIEVKIMLETM